MMRRILFAALLVFTLALPAHAQFGTNGCNPAGPMLSQQSVTTSSTFSLNPPSGTRYITVAIRTGAASSINYAYDGSTAPTTGATGNGNQLNAGQSIYLWGVAMIKNFQAIAATATTAIDVNFCQ